MLQGNAQGGINVHLKSKYMLTEYSKFRYITVLFCIQVIIGSSRTQVFHDWPVLMDRVYYNKGRRSMCIYKN